MGSADEVDIINHFDELGRFHFFGPTLYLLEHGLSILLPSRVNFAMCSVLELHKICSPILLGMDTHPQALNHWFNIVLKSTFRSVKYRVYASTCLVHWAYNLVEEKANQLTALK